MRYLGLTVLLTLSVLGVSIYSLSFTFLARKVEKQATEHATDDQGSVIFDRKNAFLKEQQDKVVLTLPLIGNYTYKDAKERSLKAGLDLQGGIYIRLKIDFATFLKEVADRNKKEPSFVMALKNTEKEKPETLQLFIKNFIANYTKISARPLEKLFIHPDIQSGLSANPSQQEVVKALIKCYETYLQANVKTYTNRLNNYGTSDVSVIVTARQEIEITSPGSGHDEQRQLKKIIQTLGEVLVCKVEYLDEKDIKKFIDQLDKKFAKETKKLKLPSFKKILIPGPEGSMICKKKHEAIVSKYLQDDRFKLFFPSNLTLIMDKKASKRGDVDLFLIYFADTQKPILQGNQIKEASMGFQQGQYVVQLNMNGIGAKKFAKHTAQHIGDSMMITFDNRAVTVAKINSEIPTGQCAISGNMSEQDAKDIASLCGSGKVIESSILEETVVGPTLSKQAQDDGLYAVLLALLLIILFMMLYYGTGGIIASLALIANAIIILGTLTQMKSALTLPGIAGLIVSLGTGIDGNVIINEAIADELKKGKNTLRAIIDGNSNSYSSILDANITTLFASIVLYTFGQGAIKGFATTLTIGTISSCFTSVLVSRITTEGFVRLFGPKRLSFSFLKKYIQNV